jgi:uncharacterized membrane protein (DUF2068 family)
MATEHQNYHARQEKFSYPIRATKSLSTEGIWTCRIWTEWYAQNASLINKTSEVAKLAAQGTNSLKFCLRSDIFIYLFFLRRHCGGR